jgi:hypothetical protein
VYVCIYDCTGDNTEVLYVYISYLYLNRNVIEISKVKKIIPKKYEKKEFSFLCLPILNYCIVIVSLRYITHVLSSKM